MGIMVPVLLALVTMVTSQLAPVFSPHAHSHVSSLTARGLKKEGVERAKTPDEEVGPGAPDIPAACRWRSTDDCKGGGPGNDIKCEDPLDPHAGAGFCDCNGDGKQANQEAGYTCDDFLPKNCVQMCDIGGWCRWRQTGDCKPDGPRVPKFDTSCWADLENPDDTAGFCDCDGDSNLGPSEPDGYKCGVERPLNCMETCDGFTHWVEALQAIIPSFILFLVVGALFFIKTKMVDAKKEGLAEPLVEKKEGGGGS